MIKNNRNRNNNNNNRNTGLRINERIRIPEVFLIDEDGVKIGLIQTKTALQMAMDKEIDLVEISPTANPPVCKLMNYGKYKFDNEKKQKESKKNQKTLKLKEIRLKYKTDAGDLSIKVKQAVVFLKDGMRVKINLKFRGREIEYTTLGKGLIMKFIDSIDESLFSLEGNPSLEGRTMSAVLSPKETKSKNTKNEDKNNKIKSEKKDTTLIKDVIEEQKEGELNEK